MAVRTVSVELKMKISDFELAAAKAAATTKALAGEFDDLGKTSSKFSTAKPTREMQNFSRVINAALKDGKTGFESIQTAIDDTKTHIANLRSQIRTGGGSESIFGDLKQANKDLRTLEGVFKDLGGTAAEQGGKNAAQRFMSNFGNISRVLATPEGLIVAAALGPVIGAGVAASVSAGVGIGLIGAAALVQKGNPAIQAAFGTLKTDAIATFKDATEPMVQPFVDAIGYADQLVQQEGPQLRKIFSDLAPAVDPLVHDFGILATDILPGVDKAVQAFTDATKDPAVTASIDHVGKAFNALFTEIGDNPQLIADTFETVNDVLVVAATSMQGLVSLAVQLDDLVRASPGAGSKFDQFTSADVERSLHDKNIQRQAGNSATKALELAHAANVAADQQKKLAESTAKAAAAAAAAGPDYQKLATELNATSVTATTLAGGLEAKFFNSIMNSDQASLAWNESLTNLRATLKQNNNIIDESAASSIKHRQAAEADTGAVLAAVSANQQIYQTMIASGVSADDATKAYDSNEKALRKQLKSAGLTKGQIDDLIGSYDNVPDKVNTIIAVEGLTDAIDNLNSTLLLLSHIDGFHANATVTTIYRTKGRPATGPLAQNFSRWGNIYEPAADGLLTHAQVYTPVNPGRFMIAEPQTKGEAFIPKNGDYGRSMSILSAAAGWYGAHVVEGRGTGGGSPVVVNLYASDPGGRALVNAIRLGVQSGGGNVVKVLTPR